MGTRADFYVKNTKGQLSWKGSIAWDGSPEGIPNYVTEAGTAGAFCHALYKWFKHDRDDATTPKQGWPWPWDTSETTDYAYVWDARTKKTRVYSWGKPRGHRAKVKWPVFGSSQMAAPGTRRSGLIALGG